jgi:protein-S-isoprenylcysteine O-methyltransferase Ste14
LGVPMNWIFLGLTAFLALTLFDVHKLKPIHPLFNGLFALGVVVLGIATYGILISEPWFAFTPQPMAWIVAGLGLGEMVFALFLALPFAATYVESPQQSTVISTGLYGVCRHPGVWGFILYYLAASVASGNGTLVVAGIVFSLADLIHVMMQDRLFFTQTLSGYADYQAQVPFLFFGWKEIRRAYTLKDVS